jgi:hypothetical protein
MTPMAAFIDPRANPIAARTRPVAHTTIDVGALTELHGLCRDSRIYDVERWIRAGRPLQIAKGTSVKQRRLTSALKIALEAGNQALILLLLCNGYDANLEPDSPLDLALRARRWDLLDLLLEWGAEPRRVSLSALFDSYNSELFERFRVLGVDLTTNHQLAETLAYHTSNKPLFGFAKRHREHDPGMQTELNIALAHHAGEGNEKGVLLCLWAGADPHARAPSLRYPNLADDDNSDGDEGDRFLGFSAIHEACFNAKAQILKRLGPDPSRDGFDELYRAATSGAVVDVLARRALPKDVGAVIRSQVCWIAIPFGRSRSLDVLQRLFESGARWETSAEREIANVRRALLKMPDDAFVETIRLFAKQDYCSRAILQDLGRTSTMRARMRKVKFIPSTTDEAASSYEPRPTRSREVRFKFGVEIPNPKPRLPRYVEIAAWRRDAREIRLDRAALFRRVWSEPVEKLAKTGRFRVALWRGYAIVFRSRCRPAGSGQRPAMAGGYAERASPSCRLAKPKRSSFACHGDTDEQTDK